MKEDNHKQGYNFSKWSVIGLTEILENLERKEWEYNRQVYTVHTDKKIFERLVDEYQNRTGEIIDFLHKWEMYQGANIAYENKTNKRYRRAQKGKVILFPNN